MTSWNLAFHAAIISLVKTLLGTCSEDGTSSALNKIPSFGSSSGGNDDIS
jgi:hypothetical protein